MKFAAKELLVSMLLIMTDQPPLETGTKQAVINAILPALQEALPAPQPKLPQPLLNREPLIKLALVQEVNAPAPMPKAGA